MTSENSTHNARVQDLTLHLIIAELEKQAKPSLPGKNVIMRTASWDQLYSTLLAATAHAFGLNSDRKMLQAVI